VGKEKAPPRHEEGVRMEKGLNRRGSSNALLRDGSRNRGALFHFGMAGFNCYCIYSFGSNLKILTVY
jgi:hypothetical protein